MNEIGKKNILFGLIYFVTTLALGMFLANKLGSGGSEWMQSNTRHLLKTAHNHGNMEALLNLVIGLIICFFGTNSVKLSQAVSILLLVGAVCHSGMLYLGGLGLGIAMKLLPLGAISMVVAVLLSILIVFQGKLKSS